MKRLITLSTLLCAGALFFLGCQIDSSPNYDDSDTGADRTTRLYKVILPEPTDKGGLSAEPVSAKLGTTVIVNYQPPAAEPASSDGEELPANNYANYTITTLTGSYNDGQKTVKIVKNSEGGGGDLNSPCPTPTYI
ncbi:MAG: hypothetical protein LBC27_08165 [Spirochaetaceae bacterium]|jgi:hypothetical protein|nr:hypothetical protein [Spirochaetaceae bacterium]